MKFVKTAVLLLGLICLTTPTASAQDYTPANAAEAARVASARAPHYPFADTGAMAAAVVILGAGFGIGMLAKAAVENMARQPEVAGKISTAMIIAAAFIEGVAFFALIIIYLKGSY